MFVFVQDEPVLGATDTFVAEKGVSREVAEDLDNNIIPEASKCIPLVWGLLHFVSVHVVG